MSLLLAPKVLLDYLGKPSREKSAVFFNIVQKAFDPPFRLNIMQNLQWVQGVKIWYN